MSKKRRDGEIGVNDICINCAYMNCTYILRCGDGSYYTGWTNDLEKRVRAHSEGRGGKYTRSRLPVELVYHETFGTKEEAMRREWEIKQLTHAQKEELIREAAHEGLR